MTVTKGGVEYNDDPPDDSFELRCRGCGGIPEIEVWGDPWGGSYCDITCEKCKIIGNQYDIMTTSNSLIDRIRRDI